jgi:predicted flap endonuclease-1-like 5' DNA nuclease
MTMKLLWFVLAGFLLGFATSTLWEWFYFRKERLKLTDRRIRELEAKLRELETDTTSLIPTNSTATSAWSDPAYRSPGVFLETEEYEASGEAELGPEPDRALPSALIRDPFGNVVAPASTSRSEPARSEPVRSEPTPTVAPRSEQTPADALRARRGDSPRSRQEVLAALRRNSEAVQRGQAPRTDAEAHPTDSRRSSQLQSTLVSPIAPEVPETPTPSAAAPAPTTDSARPSMTVVPTPLRQRWINNPALTRRTQEYPDDLSKIKGIGDVYKQRLYHAGIYTWKQIAESDLDTLRRATSAYPSSNVDEWVVQAQKLMEKTGRDNAVYSGPPPDDLTKILGIGPVSAAGLYRAGICTYEQLASTPISDLAALFPIAVAGDQPDFAQWVARAAVLADEKHRDKPD